MLYKNKILKFAGIVLVVMMVMNLSFVPSKAAPKFVAHVENMTVGGVNFNAYVQEPRTTDTFAVGQKLPLYIYLHGENEGSRIDNLIAAPGVADFWPASVAADFDIPIYAVAPRFVGSTVEWGSAEQIDRTVELIKSIKAKYPIDPNRIFIGGYSAGANGALSTAITNPQIDGAYFAGVIAARLTNMPWAPLVYPMKPIPLMVIQGAKDDYAVDVEAFTKEMYYQLENITTIYSPLGNQFEDQMMDEGIVTWMLAKPTKLGTVTKLPAITSDRTGVATLASRTMKYWVQLPRMKNFPGFSAGVNYPLIVDMHGSGGETVIDSLISGAWGSYGIEHFRDNTELPFLMALPRNPTGGAWGNSADLVIQMIENLKAKYPIDVNRIYLTGFSMGGYGSWDVAMKYPDVFAAIAPCSGATKVYDQVYKIGNLPVLALHGYEDNVTSYQDELYAAERMMRLNGRSGLITLDMGHGLVRETRSEGIMNWLLKHNRLDNPPRSIPAGYALPTAAVNYVEPGTTLVTGKTEPFSTVNLRKAGSLLFTVRSLNSGDFKFTLAGAAVLGESYSVSTMGFYGTEGPATVVTVAPKPTPTPTPTPTPVGTPPAPPTLSTVTNTATMIAGKSISGGIVTIKAGSKTLFTGMTGPVWQIPLRATLPAGTKVTATVTKNGLTSAVKTTYVIPYTPTVNTIKAKSTYVKGKATKSAVVYAKIGTKTYSAKANAKTGLYAIKIPVIKKGTIVKVNCKAGGKMSATRTVKCV